MTAESRSTTLVYRACALSALLFALVAAPGLASAKEATKAEAPRADCPAVVKDAVSKAYPGSTFKKCKAENEDGHDQFEVVVEKKGGGKLEIDVLPDGKIVQTEEVIAVDAVPAVVMKAFAARYPKARPTRAEKQTNAAGKSSYELAFMVDSKKKEATFDETGAFVEEE